MSSVFSSATVVYLTTIFSLFTLLRVNCTSGNCILRWLSSIFNISASVFSKFCSAHYLSPFYFLESSYNCQTYKLCLMYLLGYLLIFYTFLLRCFCLDFFFYWHDFLSGIFTTALISQLLTVLTEFLICIIKCSYSLSLWFSSVANTWSRNLPSFLLSHIPIHLPPWSHLSYLLFS